MGHNAFSFDNFSRFYYLKKMNAMFKSTHLVLRNHMREIYFSQWLHKFCGYIKNAFFFGSSSVQKEIYSVPSTEKESHQKGKFFYT